VPLVLRVRKDKERMQEGAGEKILYDVNSHEKGDEEEEEEELLYLGLYCGLHPFNPELHA
jgi:hypothetical protein